MFVFTHSPQGSHQEPCPAQRGITLTQPFPEFNCFGVRLYQLINKPASLGTKTLGPRPCSLPPNAGQARRTFCSSPRPFRTLGVCGRISRYCFYCQFWYCLMILYFMHIILYLVFNLVFNVFWLKDNEVIFGCIGLTDTVVCSNLSYSLFCALSV